MGLSSNVVPTLVEKKEEGNSKMGGCLYDSRRCKRKELTNIESLPDELICNILLFLSPQDIHDNARLVCRNWYHIIHTRNFIYAHFERTTSGLLIHDLDDGERLIFVGMRRGRIEISKFNYNFENVVWGSCNGLILDLEHEKPENKDALYIANPVTKRRLALPLFCHGRIAFHGIVYAAVAMVYKVVVMYDSHYGNSEEGLCAILTVGVDNIWRNVNVRHLSNTAQERLWDRPLITDGFMHWSCILTLNAETEIITENFIPQVIRGIIEEEAYCCFSTGMHLSLLISCGEFSWEVWEMKPETGEWMRLPNIDLKKCSFKQFCYKRKSKRIRNLIPVGWLKYKEVLILSNFEGFQSFVAYDVRRQEIDSFELIFGRRFRFLKNVHRNSLVWLDG